VLVEVLIMAPASDPHRAGRIPRGDTVGMNRPGPLSSPRRMRRRGDPGAGGDPNADPAAPPLATGPPASQPNPLPVPI